MATRRRTKNALSSHGSNQRGCARWFVAAFLLLWGAGFGGGGVMAWRNGEAPWFALLFIVPGAVAASIGLAMLFGVRLGRRGTRDAKPRPTEPRGPGTFGPTHRRRLAVAILSVFALVFVGAGLAMVSASDSPGGPPLAFGLVFALFGVGAGLGALHQLLSLRNPIPEVGVPVAGLIPGEGYDFAWRLVGDTRRLSSLRVELVGIEEATYTRGTNRHTDRNEFHCEDLGAWDLLVDAPQGRVQFALPSDAAATFHGRSNKIGWYLRFVGPIRFWPDVKDDVELPVGVAPDVPNAPEDEE
jgi:hypothetical protein